MERKRAQKVGEYLDAIFYHYKEFIAHDHKTKAAVFAAYIGLPQSTLSPLLRGEQIPSLKNVRKIARAVVGIETAMNEQGKELPADLKPARIYELAGLEPDKDFMEDDRETQQFLEGFRQLDPNERKKILDEMQRLSGDEPANNDVAAHSSGSPALDRVQA